MFVEVKKLMYERAMARKVMNESETQAMGMSDNSYNFFLDKIYEKRMQITRKNLA